MSSKQYNRRQKLFKALAETIRDVYEMMDYKDMTGREVWKRLPPEDKDYWSSRSISRRLRKMPDVRIVKKDTETNSYIYRME